MTQANEIQINEREVDHNREKFCCNFFFSVCGYFRHVCDPHACLIPTDLKGLDTVELESQMTVCFLLNTECEPVSDLDC